MTAEKETSKKTVTIHELDKDSLAKMGLTLNGTVLVTCKPPKKTKEMILPEGITEIQKGAFLEARIDRLVLPATVSSIPDECFAGWRAVHEIDISDGVAEIGVNAFDGCEALRTLNIGASLKSFSKNNIGECKKLDDIHVSPENKKLASFFGTVFDKRLSKPAYVPYHKSELILPPSLVNFTKNCITGKVKTFTVDLRGSSATELKNNLEKGKQDFTVRSVNDLRFITDTQEYTLDLSGYKYMVSYPFYDDIYPDKNVVKNLVGDVIRMILSNTSEFNYVEIKHRSSMGQRYSYWYRAELAFEISEIIAGLFDRNADELYEEAVLTWCDTVDEFAEDDNKPDVDSLKKQLEKHPQMLYAALDHEQAIRECIDLYAEFADTVVKKATKQQIDRLIEILREDNKSEAAKIIEDKYTFCHGNTTGNSDSNINAGPENTNNDREHIDNKKLFFSADKDAAPADNEPISRTLYIPIDYRIYIPDDDMSEITELTPENVVLCVKKDSADGIELVSFDHCMVSKQIKTIRTGSFVRGKKILLLNDDVEIEPGGISRDFHVYTVGDGRAAEYARKNGNELTILYNDVKDLEFDIQGLRDGRYTHKYQETIIIAGAGKNTLDSLTDGEEIEIVHIPDGHLNSMRIELHSAGSNSCYGVVNIERGNIIAYFMDRGYISFENAHIEKKEVLTDVIVKYDFDEKLKYRLDMICRYEKIWHELIPDYGFQYTSLSFSHIDLPDGFDISDVIKYYAVRNFDNGSIYSFCEFDNVMSIIYSYSNSHLTAFTMVEDDNYLLKNKRGVAEVPAIKLSVNNGRIIYADTKEELTGGELAFAKAYINQYRRLYGMKEIDFNGEEE